MAIELFLFDLDGTLVDSAPDLVAATNLVRTVRGLAPLSEAELRPFASKGAPGLLGKAFGITKDAPDFAELRREFLNNYAQALTVRSHLFDGIAELLTQLKARNIKIGVVTNKVESLALPICHKLGIGNDCAIILGSDSPGCAMKPNPASLITALTQCNVPPEKAVYAGDDKRDVMAAHAANLQCAVAGWGYIEDDPKNWNAQYLATNPIELLHWAINLYD